MTDYGAGGRESTYGVSTLKTFFCTGETNLTVLIGATSTYEETSAGVNNLFNDHIF
jgi:hypothetical protein